MRIAVRLAAILALATPLVADIIELRSGERIEDEVVAFDGQTFTLKTRGAIPAADVREVKFVSGGTVPAAAQELPPDAWDVRAILARAKEAQAAFPDVEGILLLDQGTHTVTADGIQVYRYHFIGLVLTPKTIEWANVALDFEEERQRVRIPLARSIAPDGTVAAADPAAIQVAEQKGDSTSFGRSKIATLVVPQVSVGSIVEYIYEIETFDPFDKNIFEPNWSFQGDQPFWESVLRVEIPEGKELNYTTRNMPPGTEKPTVETRDGKVVYTWRTEKLPGIVEEPEAPDTADLVPRVAGSLLKDWKYIFDWAAGLSKARMVATPEVKKKVEELTAGAKDVHEKIARLYHFLQREIRYISIKGSMSSGWSGHPAHETLMNRYGDCIDKSILLCTMLGEIGVSAYPVTLKTNDKETAIRDIPCLDANHAITEVHLEGRIFYLDPTHSDFRYPYFRSDDHGVTAVNEILGTIREIPVPPPDWNWNHYDIDVELSEDGTARVHVLAKYEGDYEANVRGYWRSVSEKERPLRFQQYVARIAPGAKLLSWSMPDVDDLSKPLTMEYTYLAAGFWTEAGPVRILEVPGLSYDFSEVALTQRKYDLEYDTTKKTSHRVTFKLPKGFKVKAVPAALVQETPHAAYKGCYEERDGAIVFTADFERRVRVVPAAEYAGYRAFCQSVSKFAQQKMFLLKQEE